MSSNVYIRNIFRFFIITLLQVLVLKRIQFGGENFNYVSILFYPVFLLLLPLKTPRLLLIILGFILGLTIDLFYDSPGVHASASVLIAFLRPYILKWIEPSRGYGVNVSPTKAQFGFNWFLIYSSILVFVHLLFYFSIEMFSYVYFVDIWLKTIFSFLFSMIFILLHQFLFQPKY